MTEDRDKINVLFIIVQMKMGGSEHLVWDLVRNLDRNKFSPHVAWFYEETPLQQFSDLDIPLFHIPKIKRFDFQTMKQLANIIRDNQIDVVNAHHYLSMIYSFYGAKVKNNTKLIYTEHSVWEIRAVSFKWKIAGKLFLRFADNVVGVSDKIRKCLVESFKIPETKAHAIMNGVDCDVFFPAEEKQQLKANLGLSPESIVIGIVANLKNNKNHIFLLKAFRNLQKKHSSLKLLIVGQGFDGDPESSEKTINGFITDSALEEKVLMMGSRPDVPDLLKGMDIFCLVSHKEGLPISITEAMASGLPVVGTDVEGIRDVIHPNRNGLLVPLNDVEKLTETLDSLIQNTSLRNDLGEKARAFVYEHYNLKKSIHVYEKLFS